MNLLKYTKDTTLLFVTGTFAVLVVGLSFFFPMELLAVCNDSWAAFWIAFTNTGGTAGVGVILILVSIIWGIKFNGMKRKLAKGVALFIFLVGVVGITAFLNEHLIKEQLKIHRPSIEYLHNKHKLDSETYYQQDAKDKRRAYLNFFFENNKIKVVDNNGQLISREIINVWIKEAGYSFPSGHSVTAFLLVTLLGYLLISNFKRKYLWLLPVLYLWAILIAYSRLVIGVHTPVDVTLGALWGSIIGLIIVLTGSFKILFVKEESV